MPDHSLIQLIQQSGTDGLEQWKAQYPGRPIDLSGAKFYGVNLSYANLSRAILNGSDFSSATLIEASMEGADIQNAIFFSANLQRANMRGVNARSAHFNFADVSDAICSESDFSGADFSHANLRSTAFQNADLTEAKLGKADLREVSFAYANLTNADLSSAHLGNALAEHAILKGASLVVSILDGANLSKANLSSADLSYSSLNGTTRLIDIAYNDETDFTGAGLASGAIPPSILSDLQYNIRKKNWQKFYKETKFWWAWWLFWQMTDYGRSTARIICSFACLTVVFALLYLVPTATIFPNWCPTLDIDPFVQNLDIVNGLPVSPWNLLPRALYFSIVTMTTLGFGDIYANPHSSFGHWILMAQVLIGYVLLGALITRLSIQFQSLSAK